jgi:hypothetical protein
MIYLMLVMVGARNMGLKVYLSDLTRINEEHCHN